MTTPPVSSEILDQAPPHSMGAECGLVGSLLIEPSHCDEVATMVHMQDFYDHDVGVLYAHIVSLWDAERAVDETLLIERLRESGDLERIGGTTFLVEVMASVAVAGHYKHYAQEVVKLATLRRLRVAACEALKAVQQRSAPEKVASEIDQAIQGAMGGRDATAVTKASDAMVSAWNTLQSRRRSGATIVTGYADFDRSHGGLFGGELVVLAARPGMGKTAMALEIAKHNSRRGREVLYVTMEMEPGELMLRVLCAEAGVDLAKCRSGGATEDDSSRITAAASSLNDMTLGIACPTDGMRASDVRRLARSAHRRAGIDLVVVDYLQLLDAESDRVSRQEQVAKQTRLLKGLARELSVPVLCLSQLNRQVEQSRGSHRPSLSHLRESGAIEQDADMVLFVHREWMFTHDPDDEDKAELIVAKNRNGMPGTHHLRWDGPTTSFRSVAPERYAEFEQWSGE